VRRMLTADLSSRIGCMAGGAGDVKRHAWFRGVDWALLAAARTPAAAAARAAKAGAPAPAALGSAVVLPAPPIVPHGGNGAEDDTSNFDDFSGMAESNGGGGSGGGNSGGSGGGGSDGSGLGRAEQAQFSDFWEIYRSFFHFISLCFDSDWGFGCKKGEEREREEEKEERGRKKEREKNLNSQLLPFDDGCLNPSPLLPAIALCSLPRFFHLARFELLRASQK
jgi:hypothetical protein